MSKLTPHQKKALTIDGHLALTANAGSGKTFVLARKYLSILQKNNIDVNNVAAITFTEKAASELYSKISVLIDEEIKKSINIAEHKKLEKIRRQLVSANISTIHSFCIDILKQFPVESQLDARFTAIDENLSSELIEISVEKTIRATFDNNQLQNSLKYLIRIFGSKIRLEEEIVKMIKDRKNVLAVSEKIYTRDEKEIQKHFADLFDEYFLMIWERKKVEFINALNEINSLVLDSDSENRNGVEIEHKLQQLTSENDAKVILNLIKQIIPLAFTTKNEVRQQGYLKKDLRDALSTQISVSQDIMSELSSLEISEESEKTEKELAKFGKIILEYFNYSLRNYESKKRSEGYVDFEDILLHTKILLSNNDVKKSLYERYKFILVDEFKERKFYNCRR